MFQQIHKYLYPVYGWSRNMHLVVSFFVLFFLFISVGIVYSSPVFSATLAGEYNIQHETNSLLLRAGRHIGDIPHPLPRLHTEGTLPHQGICDESLLAKRDFPLMRDAAIAWRLSGDIRYIHQVNQFLCAWTEIYIPSYNPIDETDFDAFIQAYILTREALPAKTRESTQRFLRTLADGYIARMKTHSDIHKSPKSFTWINNWQSHRIKLITLSAAALKDSGLIEQAHQLFLQQIANNIMQDGSVEDFATRDALHYVVYDLDPLIMAAIAAQSFNEDWLHEKASTEIALSNAIDWLVPYADGTKTHEEFIHSQILFDKQRTDAGVHGFSGRWDPRNAGLLFWKVSQLEASYSSLAEKILPIVPDWLPFLKY
jgi:hypothetical protein